MNNHFLKSPCSLNLILSTAVFGIFTIFLNSSDAVAQTRKLRLAIKDLEEGKAEDANEKILKFEEKEGERPPSLYVRYLYHDKTGTGTASLDLEYQYLNDAFERLEYSPDEEAKEWCEELGFCKEKYQALKNAAESKLLDAYTASRSLEKINEFITKYPSANCTWKAVEMRDSLEFASVCFTDKEADYQAFIKKRPSSKYVNQAREKLHALAFARAKGDRSAVALEEFIKSYPDAKEYDSAMMLLAEIKWNKLKESYSKKEYLEFCKRFKSSVFASLAASRIESEDWKELESMPSISGYKSFISDYPGSKHFEDAKRKMKELEYAAVPYLLANGKSALYYVFKDSLSNLEFDKIVPTASGLFLVLENGKQGAIDAWGNKILPITYDDINEQNGFLIVRSGDTFGAFDVAGNKLLDFSYESIIPMTDSLACIYVRKDEGSPCGIYKKGSGIIISPKYVTILVARDGNFIPSDGKLCFVVDETDKPLSAKYSSLYETIGGNFIFSIKEKYGVLSQDFKVIVPPVHTSLTGFEKGFVFGSGGSKYGLLDMEGNVVLKPVYTNISRISEDYFSAATMVSGQYKTRIYSMSHGGFINDVSFGFVGELHEGRMLVEVDDKIGCIDSSGTVIFEPKYDVNFNSEFGNEESLDFYPSGDFFLSCPDNSGLPGLGASTERKNYSVDPKFSFERRFSEGRCAVSYNGNYIYLDTIGHTALPMKFKRAGIFQNKVAVVEFEENSQTIEALIDWSGNVLLKGFHIEKFSLDGNRLIGFGKDSGYIVYDIENKKVLFRVKKTESALGSLTDLSFDKYGYSGKYKDERVFITPSGKFMLDFSRKNSVFDSRKILFEAYEAYENLDYDMAVQKLGELERYFGGTCESIELLCMCYIVKKEFGNARAAIGRFLTYVPNNTTLLYQLYYSEKQDNDWYGIIETVSMIMSIDNDVPIDVYSSRAYAYLQTYQYDKSIADYSKVLVSSKDVYAFNNRGFAYMKKSLYMKALGDFSIGIQYINETTPNEIRQLLYGNRGDALYQLDRKSEACAAWKIGAQLGNEGCQRALNYYCK